MAAFENSLLKETSPERIDEMDKYGRSDAHRRIHSFLEGDRLEGFMLANFGLAIIDDFLDKENRKEGDLEKLAKILKEGYEGKKLNRRDKLLNCVSKLGNILYRLEQKRYFYAKDIFLETLNFFKADQKNLNRGGEIFSQKKLDKLNMAIGGSIGRQLMYFVFPIVPKNIIQNIADKYGYAVKIADNLSDLEYDLKRGLINISKESIKKYDLKFIKNRYGSFLINHSESLLEYKRNEFIRIKSVFANASKELNKLIKKYGEEKEKLNAFRDLFHSWLKQVSELCMIDGLLI